MVPDTGCTQCMRYVAVPTHCPTIKLLLLPWSQITVWFVMNVRGLKFLFARGHWLFFFFLTIDYFMDCSRSQKNSKLQKMKILPIQYPLLYEVVFECKDE